MKIFVILLKLLTCRTGASQTFDFEQYDDSSSNPINAALVTDFHELPIS